MKITKLEAMYFEGDLYCSVGAGFHAWPWYKRNGSLYGIKRRVKRHEMGTCLAVYIERKLNESLNRSAWLLYVPLIGWKVLASVLLKALSISASAGERRA